MFPYYRLSFFLINGLSVIAGSIADSVPSSTIGSTSTASSAIKTTLSTRNVTRQSNTCSQYIQSTLTTSRGGRQACTSEGQPLSTAESVPQVIPSSSGATQQVTQSAQASTSSAISLARNVSQSSLEGNDTTTSTRGPDNFATNINATNFALQISAAQNASTTHAVNPFDSQAATTTSSGLSSTEEFWTDLPTLSNQTQQWVPTETTITTTTAFYTEEATTSTATPEKPTDGSGFVGTGQCAFPGGENLVAITPHSANAGWAMSPDQQCTPGMYCPYACAPGMVMAQWDPSGEVFSYPQSMSGGLYCDGSGQIVKPFPDRDLCVPGTGNVFFESNLGQGVSVCQTVLPGNEAMLIPTWCAASSEQVLAVPDESYWAQTSSHFYVNPPGVPTEEACVWGSSDRDVGNWSPFVVGANTVNGLTYIKLGWNPMYTGAFGNSAGFNLEVQCEGGCNGLPCSIGSRGGGNDFCVVTAHKDSKVKIVAT